MSFEYFTVTEFECSCKSCQEKGGSGFNMNSKVVDRLDQARNLAGCPFIIRSGYRCKEHNLAIGGRVGSSHIRGLAVDIAYNGSRQLYQIVNALLMVGFCRLGISKTGKFIHADMDISKDQNVIWQY